MRYLTRMIFFVSLALYEGIAQNGGPALVGAGYGLPPSVSLAPGQIVTFWVSGLNALPASPIQATVIPLPVELSGISLTLTQTTNPKGFPAGSFPVPLISVAQTNNCSDPSATGPSCLLTDITVQIPFELVVDPFTMPPFTTLTISQNGVASQTFNVGTSHDSIHVLTTCGTGSSPCVTHPDGTLISANSPAAAGEVLTIWAVGLGIGIGEPTPATGQVTPTPAPTVNDISVYLDFHPNASVTRPDYPRPASALTPPYFAGLTPGQIGLYQVNVQLPASLPQLSPCGSGANYEPVYSNLTITVSSAYFSFDGAPICVQP
jgi:hypothetical protein